LLAIADNASKSEAVAFPGQALLMEMTRLKERGLRESLRWLEDAVEIETRQAMKHQARINVYRVLLGEFADVDIDPSMLPFRLLQPFSTPAEIAQRRAAENAGRRAPDGRQKMPVVPDPATGIKRRHDRQNPPLHKEGPVLDPGTSEANASLVAADAAEREMSSRFEISLALSAELGVGLQGLTRSERGAWEKAVTDLLEVGATAGDVVARCGVYRAMWPGMRLTPNALARHWSMLGVEVDVAAASDPMAAWLERAPAIFERTVAHEILADRPGLADDVRRRYHALLDERYDEQAAA
jgi:hypothetical protein